MDKKRVLSIAASAVLAGTVFVGCSWNDDDSTTPSSSTSTLTVQASIVNGISAGGLTLDFDGDLCVNNTDLNSSTESLTLSTSQFNIAGETTACNHSVTEDYEVSVNPLKAIARATLTSAPVSLATEIGTEPLRGEKGKNVNVFSTIAIQTEQPVENINVNDLAASPAVAALKDVIQARMAAGISLATIVPDAAALPLATFRAAAVNNASTALTTAAIPTALTTNLNLNLAAINAIRAVYVAAPTTATFTTAAADATVTTADNRITAAVTAATNGATAAKLSVSGIKVKIGSLVYSGSSNNFAINRTSDQTVSSTDDVVISVLASGANDFSVEGGTLKAKITKGTNTLTITLTGVSIATDSTGKVSATIASGSTLSIDSTYSGIDSVQGTLNSAVTTNDLSFSLNTLISKITTNTSAVTATKADILTALASQGAYAVTVGISGTMPSGAITNLTDVSSTLTSGYKGFTGTVNIVASQAELDALEAAAAAQEAGEAAVLTNLGTANTQMTALTTALANISAATTSGAVTTAVTAANAAANAAKTAAQAVIASAYETTTQNSTASAIVTSADAALATSGSTSISALATARNQWIVDNAPVTDTYPSAVLAVDASGNAIESEVVDGYTIKVYVTTTTANTSTPDDTSFVTVSGTLNSITFGGPIHKAYASQVVVLKIYNSENVLKSVRNVTASALTDGFGTASFGAITIN